MQLRMSRSKGEERRGEGERSEREEWKIKGEKMEKETKQGNTDCSCQEHKLCQRGKKI